MLKPQPGMDHFGGFSCCVDMGTRKFTRLKTANQIENKPDLVRKSLKMKVYQLKALAFDTRMYGSFWGPYTLMFKGERFKVAKLPPLLLF